MHEHRVAARRSHQTSRAASTTARTPRVYPLVEPT
jgi:hypothetical protein